MGGDEFSSSETEFFDFAPRHGARHHWPGLTGDRPRSTGPREVNAMETVHSFRSAQPASFVERLRRGLKGDVVVPGDPGYDEARKVWNGAVDKRPALVAYCADARDASEVVKFARSGNHLVAVRSGGHNVAGLSVCDDGVVIDLSRMKGMSI